MYRIHTRLKPLYLCSKINCFFVFYHAFVQLQACLFFFSRSRSCLNIRFFVRHTRMIIIIFQSLFQINAKINEFHNYLNRHHEIQRDTDKKKTQIKYTQHWRMKSIREKHTIRTKSEAAVTSPRSRLIPITVYDVLVRQHLARELYIRVRSSLLCAFFRVVVVVPLVRTAGWCVLFSSLAETIYTNDRMCNVCVCVCDVWTCMEQRSYNKSPRQISRQNS